MRILITGGAGFIGSNFIIKQIAETDNFVLNLDKLTYAGNLENLQEVENHKSYQFVNGDICDHVLVEKVINEFSPTVIINFAAESHVDRSIDGPAEFINTNIIGTSVLLSGALNYYNKLPAKQKRISGFYIFPQMRCLGPWAKAVHLEKQLLMIPALRTPRPKLLQII